jgi:hypothetical protein
MVVMLRRRQCASVRVAHASRTGWLATTAPTHACCTRRVPEGIVDVVLSYCHNSLHDTSLLKVCALTWRRLQLTFEFALFS